MSRAELVVGTLAAAEEAVESSGLAQGVEALVTPGENLPGVGLMPDVPHDLVARGFEGVAERDGQLHHPQPGSDVAPGLGDDFDQPLAHLVREGLQLLPGEPFDVVGTVNSFEQRHLSWVGSRCNPPGPPM